MGLRPLFLLENNLPKGEFPTLHFALKKVRLEEAGSLYPDQRDDDPDVEEVMVEIFCDHPDVEGSFEIAGPRWKIKEILADISCPVIRATGLAPSTSTSTFAKTNLPEVNVNSKETVTEVLQDVSMKAHGKKLSPLQETVAHVIDSLLKW